VGIADVAGRSTAAGRAKRLVIVLSGTAVAKVVL